MAQSRLAVSRRDSRSRCGAPPSSALLRGWMTEERADQARPLGRLAADGGDRDIDRRCPHAHDHVAVAVERQGRRVGAGQAEGEWLWRRSAVGHPPSGGPGPPGRLRAAGRRWGSGACSVCRAAASPKWAPKRLWIKMPSKVTPAPTAGPSHRVRPAFGMTLIIWSAGLSASHRCGNSSSGRKPYAR